MTKTGKCFPFLNWEWKVDTTLQHNFIICMIEWTSKLLGSDVISSQSLPTILLMKLLLPWHILFVANSSETSAKLMENWVLPTWLFACIHRWQVYTQPLETNFFPITWPLKTSRNLLVTVRISNHLKLGKPTQENCFHSFNAETKRFVNRWRFQLTSKVFPFFPFHL